MQKPLHCLATNNYHAACKSLVRWAYLEGGVAGAQDGHDGLFGGSASIVLLATALARHDNDARRQHIGALLCHLLPAQHVEG